MKRSQGTKAKAKKPHAQKWLERSLMFIVVIGMGFVIYSYADLYQMYREKFSDKDSIYGTWVEQEVAPYMADKIVLGKKGVMKNGSLVATHFSFDGEIFEYTSGGVPMRFIMLNNKLSKMKFLTKHPYQPVYKLSGN